MNLTKWSVQAISLKFNESIPVLIKEIEKKEKSKSRILEEWMMEQNQNLVETLGSSSEILKIQLKIIKKLINKENQNLVLVDKNPKISIKSQIELFFKDIDLRLETWGEKQKQYDYLIEMADSNKNAYFQSFVDSDENPIDLIKEDVKKLKTHI